MEIRKALHRQEQIDKPTLTTGRGKTEQSHAKQTDINYILKDYAKTGYIKHAKEHQGKYDDVTSQDFQEAMFLVTQAQNMFNELPSSIRKEFGQNPEEFLNFVQNKDNENYLASLGILRGNDGIDVNGVAVNVPTKAHYDQTQQAIREENYAEWQAAEAAKKAAEQPPT